jgi:hypothetical protein
MVTDYQLNLRERMNEYLDSLKEEAIRINGDESVIWLAKDFLNLLINKLAQQNKVLEVPDCESEILCSDTDCQGKLCVVFTWEKDENWLRCEVLESGSIEFYYKNKLTKQNWWWSGNSTLDEGSWSEEPLEKLTLFVE